MKDRLAFICVVMISVFFASLNTLYFGWFGMAFISKGEYLESSEISMVVAVIAGVLAAIWARYNDGP